ncbi:hypothetical protein SVIO_006670 [Streptomyces violaceusniger]|uniref:Polyketide synthase extender module SpnB-like Rossmann fold domain-containing protein n=1 Tax=Streptomyces violaceusniger TaxID=68280 RepID=A0A4D4KPE5_STRVO|nr:hypothetical protein SVIO_006670 [Streptomyces violaceusniger]
MLHPVLLDAALQVMAHGSLAEGETFLPFTWSDISVSASGARALRMRMEPRGDSGVSLLATDSLGVQVLAIGEVVTMKLPAGRPMSTHRGSTAKLLRVDWVPAPVDTRIPAPADTSPPPRTAVLPGWPEPDESAPSPFDGLDAHPYAGLDTLAAAMGTGTVPDAVLLPLVPRSGDAVADGYELTGHAMAAIRTWLSDDTFADATLAFVTRGAFPAGQRRGPDPAAAAAAGFIRSAQSEHPGRFLVIDLDPDADPPALPPAAAVVVVPGDEPVVAVRGDGLFVPRLAEHAPFPPSPCRRTPRRGAWTWTPRTPWTTWASCPRPTRWRHWGRARFAWPYARWASTSGKSWSPSTWCPVGTGPRAARRPVWSPRSGRASPASRSATG